MRVTRMIQNSGQQRPLSAVYTTIQLRGKGKPWPGARAAPLQSHSCLAVPTCVMCQTPSRRAERLPLARTDSACRTKISRPTYMLSPRLDSVTGSCRAGSVSDSTHDSVILDPGFQRTVT